MKFYQFGKIIYSLIKINLNNETFEEI
jgi:hypothetical protein